MRFNEPCILMCTFRHESTRFCGGGGSYGREIGRGREGKGSEVKGRDGIAITVEVKRWEGRVGASRSETK